MKPLRLELKGFTAFRESTSVDFEGRRLFVITGPTGAGKSSLLDAITWALYGQVPRVGASTRQLISHGANAMSVHFEFSTRGRHYRVSRRAPGTTATRFERQTEDGEWEPIADRSRDVTEQVTKVLGLDYQTFIRTVLLPQGAFDSFLKGDQRERRDIMTRLLGLGIYAEARGIAARRAGQSRTRAETLQTQLARLDVATPESIAALEAERATLETRAGVLAERRERLAALAELARADRDAAKAAAQAGQRARSAADALARAEQELTASSTRIAQATKERAAAEAERARLGYDADAHREVERRVSLIALREEAERDVAQAAAALAAAERALQEARAGAQRAAVAHAKALQESAHAEAARGAAAAVLASAAGRAMRAAEQREGAAAEADAEQGAAERQEAERAEHARQLEAICATYEQLRDELREAREIGALARDDLKQAKAASASAVKARDRAVAAVETRRELLESLRVRHAAARLQRALKPGDRCPVCGETITEIHPEEAPNLDAAAAAVREAEHVLQEARALAEERSAAVAASTARAEAATRMLADLQQRRADVDARLGFAAEDGLPAAFEAAMAAVGAARERAVTARRAAAAHREAASALRLALARVPQEVVPADGPRAEDDAAPAALIADVEAYLQAARTAADAGAVARDAERADREAAVALERAAQAREQADAARAVAEERLAARRGDDDAPPVELRAQLAAAEQRATRARALDALLGELAAALAAAQGQREAREAARAQAGAESTAAAAACREAEDAAAAARAAFAGAWREAVADGEPGIEPLRGIMLAHEAEERGVSGQLGALGERLKHAHGAVAESQRMRDEIRSHEASAALAGALEQELRGNRFIAYVQQEAMQLLAADASQHLGQFTSGRYELIAEDDEFLVVDRLNGDERRSVKTLSGGETFLASLALALSLSEHLPQLSGAGGAVALESLFLDEGFGSLDAESLDLAVQGLETLAGGTRVIGVISHVPELAERLPDRIEVVKQAQSSTVR